MRYNVIALDLDYTLLSNTRTVSDRNRQAIEKARDKGVKVVIATGRPYGGTKRFLEELDVDQPAVTNGGAVVVDPKTGETIFDQLIDQDLARELISFLDGENCYHQIYDRSDKFLCKEYCMYAQLYSNFTGMKWKAIGDFLKLAEINTPKILCVDMEKRLKQLYNLMKEKFADRINVGLSQPYFMEIYDSGTHKGSALKKIVDNMGYSAENVIAMGDSHIDIKMIQYAGLGIAMENATPMTLKAADIVAPSNENDGVAWAIEKYVLGEEDIS